jgi:hypothetical protein
MFAIATTKNRCTDTKLLKGGGKFCKVCKDVGKTLQEYTSHYVRESPKPTSRVVCPTLNSLVCRYCKTNGHTVKHCPKTQQKKPLPTRVKDTHIVSKNYCLPVTEKKVTNLNNSVYAVFSDEDEDEVEAIITPPHNEHPTSYANVLKKTHHLNNVLLPSQVESLIPTKLNFSHDNVVTLYDITKKWPDDEDDLDDCEILYLTNVSPPPFSTNNHPLTHFVSFVDALVRDYTNNFSKHIAITGEAFQQLSKNWETEFFNAHGNRNALNKSIATNVRTRSFIMTNRYIK